MADHDPLCPLADPPSPRPGFTYLCDCALIARVRADERFKVGTEANAVVRAKDERVADLLEELDEVRERIAQEIEALIDTDTDELPLERELSLVRLALSAAARIARGGAR